MSQRAHRQEVTSALADFHREALHGTWHDRTYREYWDWFHARSEAIKAMATDDAEGRDIEGLLFDITDSAHEAFGTPADRADDLIATHTRGGQ